MPAVPATAPADTGRGARFELGEELARGGMGTIFRAYDRLRRADVAYKQLRVQQESNRARMSALFQLEYDTLARLEHPNIVRAYEFGYDAYGPYYTMELLTGSDLAALAPRPFPEVCRIIRDVGSALALLHTRRLIHRDVGPGNVRLTKNGRAKLIDFGALSAFGPTDHVIGTPSFIAPECLTGEALDQRADLYSLGALAYWLLTGAQTVRAHSIAELADLLVEPVRPISALLPSLPPALDGLIMSLLQQDPLARPASAAEVIERLDQIAPPIEPDESELALSYLHHVPLVGRDTQVQTLRRCLDAVHAGQGSVLTFEAPTGGGRSAMLDQVAIQARLRGATVLRADARLHPGPLGAALQLARVGALTFPDIARDAAFHSSFLFERRSPRSDSPLLAAERQSRIAGALEETLCGLAALSPLVLVVDDCEAADALSLALFASLAAAVTRFPILLVVSALAGRPESDAEQKLHAGSFRLALEPLSADDVQRLVSLMFGEVPNARRLASWLYAESGGNPAQCFDLLRTLLGRGEVRYARGTFTLPAEPEQGLGAKGGSASLRISGLDPEAQALVHLLGLHERPLSIEELALAAGLDSARVVSSLARLSVQGIVASQDESYTLASGALRAAVNAVLLPGQKRALHLALARAVLARPALEIHEAYQAGWHLIQAGGTEELTGAELIAESTRGHTYQVAILASSIQYLEAALSVLGRHGRADRDYAHLLAPLAVAGYYGELAAQRRYLGRALSVLSEAGGLQMARRLKRYLGGRLALITGILFALMRNAFRAKRANERSVRQNIESFMHVASAGLAAAVTAFDHAETARVMSWLDLLKASSLRSIKLAREFCVATAWVGEGRMSEARALYEKLLQVVREPVAGLDERAREQFRLGCLNGHAQTVAENAPREALADADELERHSVFMAPHAEVIRTTVWAMRGDLEARATHRARAETLAFRGGISWSATALLVVRTLHADIMSEDTVSLVRGLAEAEAMAGLSPGAELFVEITRACLLRQRGEAQAALTIWARHFFDDQNRAHFYYAPACAWYARQLRETGRAEEAKRLCERKLQALSDPNDESFYGHQLLTHQLALAEAALKNTARARSLLERLREVIAPSGSPLRLGLVERDLADVAILARDRAAFDQHFAALDGHFRTTRNPALFQLRDALLNRAIQAGVREQVVGLAPSADGLDGETQIVGREQETDLDQARRS